MTSQIEQSDDDPMSVDTRSSLMTTEADIGPGPSATVTENSSVLPTAAEIKTLKVRKTLAKIAQRTTSKRGWKLRKCIFIFMFIIAMSCGAAAVFKWTVQFIDYDFPPTEFGYESTNQSLFSGVGLSILAPFGLILLVFRISNIFVGMVFMFCIILVASFGMKAISRSYYSINTDKETTLHLFIQSMYAKEQTTPKFYDKIHERCQCCGFNAIDRILEWPAWTKSPHFPGSCCRNETECKEGKGLGWTHNHTRVLSGFRLIASPEFMQKWENAKEVKEKYTISKLQGRESLNPDPNYIEKKMFHDSLQVLNERLRTSNGFYSQTKEKFTTKFEAFPVEILRPLEIMYEHNKYNNTAAINHEYDKNPDWFAFALPPSTEGTLIVSSKLKNGSDVETKPKMHFVTRGLAENVILDRIIWMRRCQTKLREVRGGCRAKRSVVKQGIAWIKEKLSIGNNANEADQTVDGIFIVMVKDLMWWNALMASGVVILCVLISIIFWYFYSKLKSDEQANLAPPTDFDLLRLDLPSYDELDEATKALERELLRQRILEQQRIIREQYQVKATPEPSASNWKKSLMLQSKHQRVAPEDGPGHKHGKPNTIPTSALMAAKHIKSKVQKKDMKATPQKDAQAIPSPQKDKDNKTHH